jgi:S-adenosylmethionine decarboxylase
MASELSAGLHLTMDARVQDPSVFSRHRLEELFSKLLVALDMKPLGEPHTYEVPVDPDVLKRVQETGEFADSGGVTSIQVITTSHIALHAWPLENFFSADVFSCRDYDSALALSIIRETLGVCSENTNVISRHKPAIGSTDHSVSYIGP